MSDRREFLHTVGATFGALGAGQLAAAMVPSVAQAAEKAGSAPDVRVATAECLRTGSACIGHCTKELAVGNREMGNCNARVQEMLAIVRAMLELSSYESALAKRVAPICADACKACAEACAEHKAHWEHGMHLACKDCYEACLACEKACRALA